MIITPDDRESTVVHIIEFVDGYASAATRTAYRSDLSLWAAHCQGRGLGLFEVRRATSRATPASWNPTAWHPRR